MAADAQDNSETMADRAAARLAVALEDAGFDVGRTFPSLSGVVKLNRVPAVELGQVTVVVADRLADLLVRVSQQGLTE